MKNAFKCSYIKMSDGILKTVSRAVAGDDDLLEMVFATGHVTWVDNSFQMIRNRINDHLNQA